MSVTPDRFSPDGDDTHFDDYGDAVIVGTTRAESRAETTKLDGHDGL